MSHEFAIVTNALYTKEPEYVRYTDALKAAYCQECNMDYIRLSANPYPDLHPVWCKPRILLDVVQDYEAVVWMDADAATVNYDFDLPMFLLISFGKVVMARDINGWNAGVFSVSHSSENLEWLAYIDSLRHERRYQRGYREQQAMADSFGPANGAENTPWAKIVSEPPPIIGWNSYPDIYNRKGDPNIYQPSHFILHIPGASDGRRAAIFKEVRPAHVPIQF